MNVYLFLILLFNINSIKAKNIPNLDIKKDAIGIEIFDHLLYKSYNLTDLQELKSTVQYYNNLDLTKTKFLIIDWDEIRNLNNNSFPVIYINIFYPQNITTNVINDKKRISKWKLECNINKCTFGLKFIFNNMHYSNLIDYNQNINPDYSFIIMFTMKTNRLSFKTISYGGHNYPLYYCPTKYWFINQSNIIFQHHESLENIKYFDRKQSRKILLPIFQQTLNSKFFICGMIKQPMLSDIEVGYDIKNNNEKSIEINRYDDQVFKHCNVSTIDDIHFIFSFVDFEFNYNNTRKIIKIERELEKVYYGEHYYIYTFYNNGRIDGSLVDKPIKPRCIIIDGKINEYSKIVPNIEENKIELFTKNNTNYYLIDKSFYNRKINLKCMTKFTTVSDSLYSDYYSMAAEIELKKNYIDNDTILDDKNILFSTDILNKYGLYICNVKSKSKSFLKAKMVVENAYFLPDHFTHFNLSPINTNVILFNFPICKYSYGDFSYLTYIQITYLNSSQKIINTDNYNKEQLDIEYFNSRMIFFNQTVKVTCNYKTIIDSIFETHQLFEHKETSKVSMIVFEHPFEHSLIYDMKSYFFIFISIIVIFSLLFLLISCINCKSSEQKIKNSNNGEKQSRNCKSKEKVETKESISDNSYDIKKISD